MNCGRARTDSVYSKFDVVQDDGVKFGNGVKGDGGGEHSVNREKVCRGLVREWVMDSSLFTMRRTFGRTFI